MKVGYFQFNPVFGDVKSNINYVVEKLAQVQADLVVLPELFNTGYQFLSREEAFEFAEQIPQGFTTQALVDACKDSELYIAAGLVEKANDQVFNSAVLVGSKGFMGSYRKTHLFAEEKLIFDPGDTGFQVFDIGKAKVGLMVCFDWFFPESVRSLALKGADIIAHCANLVLPYCPDAMMTRCLENHVYAVTANRTGNEKRGGKKELKFIGKSEIVNPDGKILARASEKAEEIKILEIDPLRARNKQINAYNDILSDRRPDLYF